MKRLLLAFLLILSFSAKGQNAYYDSKYIIDWLNNPNSDKKVETERQLKVYNKLKAYTAPDNSSDSAHYYMVDAIYAEFFRRNEADITLDKYIDIFKNKTPADFAKLNKKDADVFKKIRNMISWRTKHIKAAGPYQALIGQLTYIIDNASDKTLNIYNAGNTNISINGIEIPASVTGEDDAGVIHLFGRTTFSQERLENVNADTTMATISDLRDSLRKSLDYMERKKREYDVNAKLYFMELTSKGKRDVINEIFRKNLPENSPLIEIINRSVEEGQRQADIRIVAQQSQPSVSLSNFKMPSQGEIIDALAIYVAKRFKQEAIMYMIDQLKENMVDDTLFTIMFPETRKLLFGQNAFTIPHFGTEWKYAISKDYTLMPDHMLSSNYIGMRFDQNSFKCMHDTWLLAKMVEKKYSYVEIMRNYATNESEKMQTPLMQTFTRWSYMLNEELFTTYTPEIFGRKVSDSMRIFAAGTTNVDYWIAPSTFNKEVSPEQLSLMLAMLRQRYGEDVEGDLAIDLGDSLQKQAPRLAAIKKWMSRNLLILNQFQKNQEKLFTTEVKDDEKALFNGVSYWTFMNDILHSFIDTAVMRNIPDFDPEQLEYVSDVNEIYGSFQNKNYPAAVSQMLGVIEHLCNENTEYMLSQDLKFSYKTASLAVAQDRKKLAHSMSMYSTYFTAATNRADEKDIRDRFNDKLNGIQTVIYDAPTKYDVAAFDAIKQELDDYHWCNTQKNEKLKMQLAKFKADPRNSEIDYLIDPIIYTVDSSIYIMASRYNDRLSGYGNSYCRSLNKAKSYASLLTDIMNSGTNSQNLSKVIEAHAAPVTSYKLKRYNRRTLDIGAFLGAYFGAETLPQQYNSLSTAKAVYGLTVPIGFNYTWATLKPLNAERVKYPYARRNDQVREFRGVSHTISLSIIDIAAPVAYRLTNNSEGALPKNLEWSQLLSPGLHYRYGFKNAPICLSTGVQYTPQLRTLAGGNQLSAVRTYIGVLFDMPLLFIKK